MTQPNKAEKQWLDAITRMGCICCYLAGKPGTPAEPHHMLSGGRRMGHLFTIPLCYAHHRSGRNDEEVTSRDQSQRRFEARYGTEAELLEKTKAIVLRQAQPTSTRNREWWADRPEFDMDWQIFGRKV